MGKIILNKLMNCSEKFNIHDSFLLLNSKPRLCFCSSRSKDLLKEMHENISIDLRNDYKFHHPFEIDL